MLFRRAVGTVLFGLPRAFEAQELAQWLIGGPREADVLLGDRCFRCLTSHRYYWLREEYEPHVRKLLLAYLRPDSVVYDIGAHWGYWEVLLSALCRRMVAFEPSPSNYRHLTHNLRVNQIGNVQALNVAAGRAREQMRIEEQGSMTQVSDKGDLLVNVVPVDEITRRPECGTPDLIKLDVEGFAGDVLAGMQQLLASSKPTILAEVHNAAEEQAFARLTTEGYVAQKRSSSGFPYHIVLSSR